MYIICSVVVELGISTAFVPSGLGSLVDITIGYGLDGPGIESRWGPRFSAPVQTGPGAHPASCTMGTGSFPGVNSGWSVTLTPHPFWCRGHERVELYLYSAYGPYGLYRASVPVQGCTLLYLRTKSPHFVRIVVCSFLLHSSQIILPWFV